MGAAAEERSAADRPRLPGSVVRRIVAVLLGWTALCWLVIGGLLHPIVPGGWATVALVVGFVSLPIGLLARSVGSEAYPSTATRLLFFRPFWYTQLLTPLVAAAGLVGLLVGLPLGAAFRTGRAAMAITAPVLVALLVWGYRGAGRLTVRRLGVSIDGLPRGLAGLRIVQLSDLHVGPHTSGRHLARIAAAVREANPDLIAFTGDQVDDYARDVEPFEAAFADLAAPLGVFAIAGNHDIYAGWPRVRQGLEAIGIRVLVNRSVRLERGGAAFWLAGTGDPAGRYRPGPGSAAPDIDRTLADVPLGGLTIALAHNPALWPALAERGVAVTLSGHTHHGQLSIPRLGWSLATPFVEFAMGEYRRGRSYLYVSPGANYWGIPFRIGSLPEVTVLTLEPAAG